MKKFKIVSIIKKKGGFNEGVLLASRIVGFVCSLGCYNTLALISYLLQLSVGVSFSPGVI